MMFMLMVIMNEAIHSPREQSVQGKQMVGHNCYSEITSSFQIVINSAVSMIQVTATITTAKSTICFASITTAAAAVTAILITIISTG